MLSVYVQLYFLLTQICLSKSELIIVMDLLHEAAHRL